MLCFGSVNGQEDPNHFYAGFDSDGNPIFFCEEIEKEIAIKLSNAQMFQFDKKERYEIYLAFLDESSKFASIYTAVCK